MVVFGSVKGSPGVTCLAAGVAASWQRAVRPGASRRRTDEVDGGGDGRWRRPLLLVEADPSGGVLAARAGLGLTPGLTSLAAQARGGELSVELIARHMQVLPSGAAVLLGPIGADQARSVVSVLGGGVARFVRSRPDEEMVLVDAGRLDTDSPASPMVAVADGVVLVVRSDGEGVGQAAAWLRSRPELGGRVAFVLRAPTWGAEFVAREIANELGVAILSRLPEDLGAGAQAVTGPAGRGAARSGWWRAVAQVTGQVARLRPLVQGGPLVRASIQRSSTSGRPSARSAPRSSLLAGGSVGGGTGGDGPPDDGPGPGPGWSRPAADPATVEAAGRPGAFPVQVWGRS